MRLRRLLSTSLLSLGLTWSAHASADALDSIGKRLGKFDSEAKQLASGIRRPSELGLGGSKGRDLPTRRTIEAQVNFGVGNYDDAAIVLYDVVERFSSHRIYDEALFYLAESLYLKGDKVAARSYFAKLADTRPSSRYYQQALERLVELSIQLADPTDIEKWLTKLDEIPAGDRRESVPYVRGKYDFHLGNYDKAIASFRQVSKKGEYFFQARYFIGASYIAQKNIDKAMAEFSSLVRVPAKTKQQKKVVELSFLAMGRIHYERNEASSAIDRYLEVPRQSKLFNETMYEVAWVYVRNKEFDKALRALELLALADPMSTRLPEVKILEGNLRIRKAQRLSESSAKSGSDAEYARAMFVFDQVRQLFADPHRQLAEAIAESHDTKDYLAQITRRNAETFDIKATLPVVAAAWLREEKDVARIVLVASDLNQIENDIGIAEKTIERLEQALSTPSRVNIFPSLATKRVRSTEILEEIFQMRRTLAEEQRKLLNGSVGSAEQAEMDRLRNERLRIDKALKALPDSESLEGERITKARARAIEVDKRAAEVSTTIGSAEAQLVAMEKYLHDQGYKEVKAGDLAELKLEIDKNRLDIEELKGELADVRRDALLAQDRAGTGDDTAVKRKALRTQVQAAIDAELRYLQTQSSRLSGGNRSKADRIAQLNRSASSVVSRLENANTKINAIVEAALGEVEAILSDEKAKLVAYRHEYSVVETDSQGLGGDVLASAFKTVSAKLYSVLMRADVGMVDVAWSMKESADRTLRRLNLDQAREMRTLDTDFSDVIEEIRELREQERIERAEREAGSSVREEGDSP